MKRKREKQVSQFGHSDNSLHPSPKKQKLDHKKEVKCDICNDDNYICLHCNSESEKYQCQTCEETGKYCEYCESGDKTKQCIFCEEEFCEYCWMYCGSCKKTHCWKCIGESATCFVCDYTECEECTENDDTLIRYTKNNTVCCGICIDKIVDDVAKKVCK